MKHLFFAFALVASSTCISAFAQTPSPAQTTNGSSQIAPNDPDQWVGPHGEAPVSKTRAQVYQELVQAERDGQLATLNSTVYAHP
jgi:Domain of unknown function (DUF4148)